MIRSSNLTSRALELMHTFPTMFFMTAEEAMARSSNEISGSSRIWVLPCGAFTWTDGDGSWIHPEYGNRYDLEDFYDVETDEDNEPMPDAPVATEIADRTTHDDPFSRDNFGPWTLMDGEEVEIATVTAKPSPFGW